MYLERNWKISETERIDSVIARVQAHDNENDELTFDLEPHTGFGIAPADDTRDLPFRIDPHSGIVYLNDSLVGRGGENFFLYVTVSDGELTAKNEVFVNIQLANATKYNGGRPPAAAAPPPPQLPSSGSYQPHASNITRLLPPFHLLPGVTAVQRPPLNHIPPPPHQPSPPTYGDANEMGETDKTMLVAVGVGGGGGDHQVHTYPNDNNRAAAIDVHQSTTRPSVQQPPAPPTPPPASDGDFGASVRVSLPVILTTCGIVFSAVGVVVAVFMFRRHLCALGKSLKKKSKAEMAKKSNQSQISIATTEDSRNSMVLQHWNGPTAFSNRYVPWERDTNQQQQQQVPSAHMQVSRFKGFKGGGKGIL